MSSEITPETDPQSLARRLTGGPDPQSLRSSEARRRLLETWADILTDTDLSVDFTDEEGQTAHVTLGNQHREIVIPSWQIEQPLTELDRKPYDLLVQRTLTLHEVGHVLFTDGDEFIRTKQQLPSAEQDVFHLLFNALEDGAIEEQLRQEYDVAGDIELTNANFRYEYDEDGVRVYDLLQATQTAALNLAVHDSGHLAALLDESNASARFNDSSIREAFESNILPELKSTVTDILSQPDPKQRVDRVLELWKAIRDQFTDYDLPEGMEDPENDLDPDTVGDGSSAGALSSTDKGAVSKHADDVADGSANQPTPNTETKADEEPGSDSSDSGTGGGSDESSDTDSHQRTEDNRDLTKDDTNSSESADGTDDAEGLNGSNKRDTTDEDTNTDESRNQSNSDVDSSEENRAEEFSNSGEVSSQDTGSPSESDRQPNIDTTDEQNDGGSNESAAQNGQSNQSSGIKNSDSSGGDGLHAPSEELPEPGEENADSESTSDRDSADETQNDNKETNADQSDLERRYNRLVERQEHTEGRNQEKYEDAIDEYADVLDELERQGLGPRSLDIADGSNRRQTDWPEIRRESNQLKRILEQQLQEEHRSEPKRGRRSGRLDTRSLSRVARDDPRVFQQDDKPDEKDYQFVFVLDRSGSMGSEIQAAERALVTLARALEEIDVEVSIIDMYRSSARLAKPFGVDTENALDRLLTGATSGGTPLSDVLRVASGRLEEATSTPAMVVVTDGMPDNRDAYLQELQDINFPVMGVYLSLSARSRAKASKQLGDSKQLYDRRKVVINESDISTDLRALCREIMF